MGLWRSRARLISTPRRATSVHLAVEPLEGREVPTVGGGFTAGGLLGQYFADSDLTGDPAFSRRDVRIDFDWGDRAPGGSNSPSFQQVGADDFSVRWTGQLIGQFSELYTFTATGDDGVRLWLKPTGGPFAWTLLIDQWDAGGTASADYFLAAGHAYDVKVEYRDITGPATARLSWSSPSTPAEVIDPAVNLGVNAVTYDHYLYADAAKTSRNEWGDPVDYFGNPRVAMDANGWPLSDAGHLFWESQDPNKTNGVYLLQFQGQAEVSGWINRGRFSAGGVDYGLVLPVGAGYDPVTNTTTATVTVEGADIFGLNFVHTKRMPADPEGTGVTGVQFMRPTAPDATTSYAPGEMFDTDVKDALSRFTTLRYMTANFNAEVNWADRKLPSQMVAAWADRAAVWEYEVELANETGKDLYITLPVLATEDYVRNLANLVKYGSDGVNPYTGPVDDPVYPGLNPNLRVYVEWGNEIWNFAFSQGGLAADQGRAAVLAGTPEGQIVNFDGQRENGDFRRWAALKTVEASNTFREVWGDPAMGDRVRVLFEYQYDNVLNTAVEALRFIDQYFNNGDGIEHVADPHPVSYFIWGAGGASYFGATNPRGLVTNIIVPGGTFETARVGRGGTAKVAPTGTPWQFEGDAGVYRDVAGVAANVAEDVPGVGSVPATPQGAQALYVSGTGSAWVTINFPRAGAYAIDFQAAGEFGPNMGNTLDFFLDDQRVTPNGGSVTPPPFPWWPGNGNRDSTKFSPYGTVPVQITTPGKHTFKIVGRGTADQTTVIDDVRIESLDAIFKSKIPGGGQAAGQVSQTDYQAQQIAQARYPLAYGLKVVAYEGGWSLGGDQESVPIQNWAKYFDPRTIQAMSAAIDAFYRAGGELNVLGTYDQWRADDAIHADSYPIVQGIDARLSVLPVAATGIAVRGRAPVPLRPTTAYRALSAPHYLPPPTAGPANPGDWFSWTVVTSLAGNYKVMTNTAGAGTVAIYVDGQLLTQGASGPSVGGILHLTAGAHTIRVQSLGGRLTIRGATIDLLDQ
jgi:hypothetical protein